MTNIDHIELEDIELNEGTTKAICPVEPEDYEELEMSDEEFEKYVAALPKMSNNQVRRYMKLMSRHKPGNEAAKAKRKAKNRAKNKVARKQRKANRK